MTEPTQYTSALTGMPPRLTAATVPVASAAAPAPAAAASPPAAAPAAAALADAAQGWGVESFALKHPFTLGGRPFAILTIRTPTGADMVAMAGAANGGAALRELALRVVDADARVLDAMHGTDYMRLVSALGKFLAADA